MQTNILEELTDAQLVEAIEVFSRPVEDTASGICGNYIDNVLRYQKVEVLRQLLIDCCKCLEVYSGNWIYPIAHAYVSAEDAYYIKELWDKESKYCQSRILVHARMLDQMIAELRSRQCNSN